jgi:hypothetical protein
MFRVLSEILLGAVLGTAAIVIPVLLDPSITYLQAIFLPFMGAVERMGLMSLIALTAVGVFLGRFGRSQYWVLGLSTVAFLFVWSFIDQRMASAAGFDRHNLLPIEWFSYLVISIFPILGSRFGAKWKKRNGPEISNA